MRKTGIMGTFFSIISTFLENCFLKHNRRKKTNRLIPRYKNRASEGVFYIGGHGCELCQFIELVTFVHCVLYLHCRNIALGGYLNTQKHFEHL